MFEIAMHTIAGQITLIAFTVLTSLTPYFPIIGAEKNTIIPIKNAQEILKMETTRMVFTILLCSFFCVYIAVNLEIDATIQYAKGKSNGKWWSIVTPSDIKTIDSPYNTYEHKGLPPHPIANPGLSAINAALNPKETNCIFYLHDRNRMIHCAVTYQEHLKNIEKYLN